MTSLCKQQMHHRHHEQQLAPLQCCPRDHLHWHVLYVHSSSAVRTEWCVYVRNEKLEPVWNSEERERETKGVQCDKCRQELR